MPAPPLVCFAVAAPGLEPLVAGELLALRALYPLEPDPPEPGGVTFRTDLAGVAAANLHLRVASRVLVRVGSFHAAAFHELERKAERLPWTSFLASGCAPEFRVTSRKSRLYHQEAIAERLAAAVAGKVGGVAPSGGQTQEFVVRIFRDECTISADASGELLHRRGYRLATARAPLRETLAAAMLLAAGWDGSAPLLDPMCGSGTIPIEAALIARRIPPGLQRRFAVEHWPEFDPEYLQRMGAAARERVLPGPPARILGSDRDAGAVLAAAENATRAGVGGDVEFRRAAISSIEPPSGLGRVVTNPPYGVRVGERARLRDLFAQFGNVARRSLSGWQVAMLSSHVELERQTGLPLAPVFRTVNGGIRVRLVQGVVP